MTRDSFSEVKPCVSINRASVALGTILMCTGLWVLPAQSDLAVGPGPGEGGRPVDLLHPVRSGPNAALVTLGELAFKASTLFAGNFSCDSCHPDGGTTETLFFPGLSNKPGNIDMTHRAMTLIEDGIYNPINIPSLLGNTETAPFGRHQQHDTIEDFTLFAITAEFGGQEPGSLLMNALVAFQETLDFPPNPFVDGQGRLTDDASEAMRRGAAIFRSVPEGDNAKSCADCHPPSQNFLDGKVHNVGTGEDMDTASLRRLAGAAPYGRDGQFDTLRDAVAHFASFTGHTLAEDQLADLVAYVEAVGADRRIEPAKPNEANLAATVPLLAMPLEERDGFLLDLVIEQLVWELSIGTPDALSAVQREKVVSVLRRIESAQRAGDYDVATEALAAYEAMVSR